MPAKEIKELRTSGNLEEALKLANAELAEAESNLELIPENEHSPLKKLMVKALNDSKLLWPKRNISWVYYDYLKLNNSPENFVTFISWLDEIKKLELPIEEKMMFEQLCWQVGKMAFSLQKSNPQEHFKGIRLFETIQSFHFPKPSEGYSFLFKALHKSLKDTDRYIQFADWWDFKNFMPGDFQTEKLPSGKDIMAIAEQAYITYAKQLLPKTSQHGEIIFSKTKVEEFLPTLSEIVEGYPQFQYPAYFNAKLLLAFGDKENMLGSLLPFAKKKRNDFWVWEILAEAFSNDTEKVFACYCKALSCKSPDEMLVSLRQKMARILISKKLLNEAKTEIDLLVKSRVDHNFSIPAEVINWQSEEWYKNAVTSNSNFVFYKTYIPIAEALLFSDITEESIIVEFVNSDKKILNFIASETKFGFFKYDRFFKNVQIGDTLKVRFQGGSNGGIHQIYTAIKTNDNILKNQFVKEISGIVRIPLGKPFGFLEDAFIHPSIVLKMNLTDGISLSNTAMKSFNQEKKQWTWKLI